MPISRMGGSAFSPDYRSARSRFRGSATARGFRVETLAIDEANDWTVDVALGGDPDPDRLVVVSSGLHGVEGFLGSAIQNALLEGDGGASPTPGPGCALLLIHALDPFGYDQIRRVDAANVDLNRNFLKDGEAYAGSPPAYADVDALLNPKSPPGGVDLLRFESLPAVWRHGGRALKRAIVGGQYDFPEGLFFGGHGPSAARRLIEENLPRWVGPAEVVVHLDVHTGLGRWGRLALLLEHDVAPERAGWMAEVFGSGMVLGSGVGFSYPSRGGLGSWCQARFADRAYHFLCAEFGTYEGVKVLAALRAENRAHHWGNPDDAATLRARRRLLEAFTPGDPGWRASALAQGLATVRRAFEAASRPSVVA